MSNVLKELHAMQRKINDLKRTCDQYKQFLEDKNLNDECFVYITECNEKTPLIEINLDDMEKVVIELNKELYGR